MPKTTPDKATLDELRHTLRDHLRRADALITTAEREIEEGWSDTDKDDSDEEREMRHRTRIEYLVEGGKLAVRAALRADEQVDEAIAVIRKGAQQS